MIWLLHIPTHLFQEVEISKSSIASMVDQDNDYFGSIEVLGSFTLQEILWVQLQNLRLIEIDKHNQLFLIQKQVRIFLNLAILFYCPIYKSMDQRPFKSVFVSSEIMQE